MNARNESSLESARPGRVADLAQVQVIGALVKDSMKDNRGGAIFFTHEVGFATPEQRFEMGVDEDTQRWFSVAGEFEGVFFGFATAEIRDLSDGEMLGVVHDFVVDPEAREVGIGEAMMDLIVATLKERGCIGVDAWALPGDRESKNFFERFGLKARLLTAHRRFD